MVAARSGLNQTGIRIGGDEVALQVLGIHWVGVNVVSEAEVIRVYADRETHAAFGSFNAGARSVARMVIESTLETDALREKLLELAK